jgi:hypothetical protein
VVLVVQGRGVVVLATKRPLRCNAPGSAVAS